MHLSVAVAKIDKWSVRTGGDTLEMIERPHGGLSVVLADGQSSGPAAKSISIWVVRKVVSELAEGVRDGAAARAANDTLHAMRRGKVSATLVILSADLHSRSMVVTRCGNSAIYARLPCGEMQRLQEDAPPLGFYRHTRPCVDQFPLEPGLLVCGFTDGLIHAGSRQGQQLDVPFVIEEIWKEKPSAQAVADGLLARAIGLDEGRPVDDTSVAVLHILAGEGTGPRTMRVEMPVPDISVI